MARPAFKPRILVTFLMALGFLVAAGSGVVLYATPRGSVAGWTGWTFAGLGRDDWMNMHLVTGLVFVVTGLFHLWFNWKPLKAFLWQRAAGTVNRRAELALAAALMTFAVVGAVEVLPPIDQILALREWARDGGTAATPAVPRGGEYVRGGGRGGGSGQGGGFGRMTVRDIASQTGLDYESVRARLAARGIVFADGESVRDIAARHGMRPAELGRMAQEQ